ncbi:MAG: hypothetical protein EXR72_16315 [Myxococcales bacterium]|nr:hypothetical protein [Myxococcales bacterium]
MNRIIRGGFIVAALLLGTASQALADDRNPGHDRGGEYGQRWQQPDDGHRSHWAWHRREMVRRRMERLREAQRREQQYANAATARDPYRRETAWHYSNGTDYQVPPPADHCR